MPTGQDLEKRLLAAAVYELRILLWPHLGGENTPAGAAAQFAYALHNQALSVLAGESIDVLAALDSLDRLAPLLGGKYLDQFRERVLAETLSG